MSSVLLECKRYDLDLVNQIVQSKVNLFWCTEVSVRHLLALVSARSQDGITGRRGGLGAAD